MLRGSARKLETRGLRVSGRHGPERPATARRPRSTSTRRTAGCCVPQAARRREAAGEAKARGLGETVAHTRPLKRSSARAPTPARRAQAKSVVHRRHSRTSSRGRQRRSGLARRRRSRSGLPRRTSFGNTAACCGVLANPFRPRQPENRSSRSGFMPWDWLPANELKFHLRVLNGVLMCGC